MKKKLLAVAAAFAAVFATVTAQAEVEKKADSSILCTVKYEMNNPSSLHFVEYETNITAESVEKARKKLFSEEFLKKIAYEIDQQENAHKIQVKKSFSSLFSEKIIMTCKDYEKQQTYVYEISALIK